ncbi:hypothetical protein G7Y89_g5594 [Cudoniella acicularis]|uniref:Ca3427-like PBP 2 domain-containing protein n=1 Tax=Cudoniella acicularis TaxID=354080 RepID=A0A8H4RPG3_9HELO|nr:hypothetical protein G7Y89_g5594 [Cudoniella acicularis]
MTETQKPLRIGFVPEHFSTPLHYAQKYFSLSAELIPFPSGTGHMITSLRAGEIDIGIGLTEGWVAGLGKEGLEGDGGYRIVGTYVETPLCWAISTGHSRTEITSPNSLLTHTKCGVSRIGSGSYIMSFVLSDTLTPSSRSPFTHIPLQTFASLRDGVNNGTADFFMWEHFTSKRYYDNGSIKKIGEIYTPWPSWQIVASTSILPSSPQLEALFTAVNKGIQHFNANAEENIKYISTELDYSEEDAREWLGTVKFAVDVKGVDEKVVQDTVGVLRKAGVLVEGKGLTSQEMVSVKRS